MKSMEFWTQQNQSVKKVLLLWLSLLATVTAVYGPSLAGPYVIDDFHTIATNGGIQTLSNWWKIWTSGKYYSSLPSNWAYRPVTSFSNLWLWWIGGGETWPFHVFKVIVFFFQCMVLWKLWSRLLPNFSKTVLAGGLLLFALNPVHTEVVSDISASSTLLAGFFCTLSLSYYLDFRDRRNPWRLFGCGLAIVLAVLAKEEGVVAVGLIPLTELYLQKSNDPSGFKFRRFLANIQLWKTFALIALAGIIGVGLVFAHYEPNAAIARGGVGRWPYFLTQLRAYIKYMSDFFFARELNADNLQFGFSWAVSDTRVIIAIVLNVVVIAIGLLTWKRWPQILYGILFFYIGVSPASSVIPLSEPVNDHRAYIGYVGFALIAMVVLNGIYQFKRLLMILVVAAVAILYGWMTFERSLVWGDAISFWRDTAAKNPISARAQNNLAVELMARAEFDEALQLLIRCKTLEPTYASCYINLGVVRSSLGRDLEADLEFQRALPLDSSVVQSRFHYATFLSSRGLVSRALALAIEGDAFAKGMNLQLRIAVIDLYSRTGRVVESKNSYLEALSLHGRHEQLVKIGRALGYE